MRNAFALALVVLLRVSQLLLPVRRVKVSGARHKLGPDSVERLLGGADLGAEARALARPPLPERKQEVAHGRALRRGGATDAAKTALKRFGLGLGRCKPGS